MSAGFEVRNGSEDVVTINQDYKVLVLRRKIKITDLSYMGTVWTISNPWDQNILWGTPTFKNLPQYQLILNDDELFWGITICQNIGNSVMVKRPSENDVRFNIPSGINLDGVYIYTFGLPYNSGSHCGLQVFNEKSEIVFDSALKHLRILRSDWNSSFTPWTTALIGSMPYWDWGARDVTWYYEIDENSDGKLTSMIKYSKDNGSGKYASINEDGAIVTVDVTNY